MGVKALQLFQGEDWTTHRPTVAQAFDTLDRLRMLCMESMPEASSHGSLNMAAVLMSDRAGRIPARANSDHLIMVLAAVAGLCDDLAGELDAVAAELSPYLQGDVAHRWMNFEMQTHLNAMRDAVQEEREADEPSIIVLDEVMSYAERIDALLKYIDQ